MQLIPAHASGQQGLQASQDEPLYVVRLMPTTMGVYKVTAQIHEGASQHSQTSSRGETKRSQPVLPATMSYRKISGPEYLKQDGFFEDLEKIHKVR